MVVLVEAFSIISYTSFRYEDIIENLVQMCISHIRQTILRMILRIVRRKTLAEI